MEQPHISGLAAELKAEIAHCDPLKETRVPVALLIKGTDYRKAENVRDKIRHKFDLGLYGKFPMNTVVGFVRDHHEKKAFFTSNWRDLILHTV